MKKEGKIHQVMSVLNFLLPGLLLHRFTDHGGDATVMDKVYLSTNGNLKKGTMVLPAGNLEAMLTNIQAAGNSVARILAARDSSLTQKNAPTVLSGHILFTQIEFPLLGGDDSPLMFADEPFEEYTRNVPDPTGGTRFSATSVLVPPPVRLRVSMQVADNQWFTAESLRELFETAGMTVRLGTYRKRFGAFEVADWKVS